MKSGEGDRSAGMPRFSVVIPTYNRAGLLGEALESVLAQSYRDYELIVCDDGSTDETPEVLARYPGVRVVRSDRRGPGGARNAALAVARGRYIACLDSDDRWAPRTLEWVATALDAHPGRVAVFLTASPIEDDERSEEGAPIVVRYPDPLTAHCAGVHVGSGLLGALPANILRRAGGFAEGFTTSGDIDLALRIAEQASVIVIRQPAAVRCRSHPGQITRDPDAMHRGGQLLLRHLREGAYGDGGSRRRRVRLVVARHVGATAFSLARHGERVLAWDLYRGLRSAGLVSPSVAATWTTPLACLLAPTGALRAAEWIIRQLRISRGFWNPTPPPGRPPAEG